MPPNKTETFRHTQQCPVSAINRGHSLCRNSEKTLGASTPLGSWFSQSRRHIAFGFQAVQRGVNCADRNVTLCACGNLLSHRDSIGSVTEAHKCQNHNMLEFPEMIAIGHYLYNIEEIYVRVKSSKILTAAFNMRQTDTLRRCLINAQTGSRVTVHCADRSEARAVIDP